MPTLAVLVATARTQGQRGNDFLACSPDELVDITSSCDRGDPDGGCGCCRAFTGLGSCKATTIAEVVERPISFADYVVAHHEYHREREAAGLPRIALRDRRSVSLTQTEQAGVPISILSLWAGHHDPAFTLKHYVQADEADLSQGMEVHAELHRSA